jgi:hypothetical protein
MAISDAQKIDYLWKKLGYGAAKTDTNANKAATNEAIASPLLLRGDKLWSQAGDVPTVIPTTTSEIVQVYLGSNAVETTEDNTATARRTWKTGTTDWIPPEFGSTYQVKVYVDDASAADPTSTGTQLFAAGSGNNDEWFFDYQAGVLNFIGSNLPSNVTSSKKIYIVGARYIGAFFSVGALGANAVVGGSGEEGILEVKDSSNNVAVEINSSNATISTSNVVVSDTLTAQELILETVLATEYGGTGLTNFTQNGIMYASDASTLAFVTGTSGKVLQIGSDGVPLFDDIDGGEV